MDEPRALQRAGWAGAASIVLLVVAVPLCASVGEDDPSVSDAAIIEGLHDSARQAAAGAGLPVLGAGIALLLWFTVGLRQVLGQADPTQNAPAPDAARTPPTATSS
jgi:hypothetical protein